MAHLQDLDCQKLYNLLEYQCLLKDWVSLSMYYRLHTHMLFPYMVGHKLRPMYLHLLHNAILAKSHQFQNNLVLQLFQGIYNDSNHIFHNVRIAIHLHCLVFVDYVQILYLKKLLLMPNYRLAFDLFHNQYKDLHDQFLLKTEHRMYPNH